MRRLLLLAALPLAFAPAAEAKPKPKYFFHFNQTSVITTTSICKSIPSGTVTERTILTSVREIKGYIGGDATARTTEQTRLTRTGDNPYLPDSDVTTPKRESKFAYDQKGDWKRGDGRIKFDPVWGLQSLTLKLPKVNRERTKSFTKKQKNTPPPSDRCTYEESADINGDLTIQRVQ
jgi:hypothetical protein